MFVQFSKLWRVIVFVLFLLNASTVSAQIVDLPDFQLEECNAEWPENLITTWKDKCGGEGEVISDAGIDDGSSKDGCVQYRLYTFAIKDECENFIKTTTRVAREIDTTDPEITDIEDFKLEGCNASWPEYLVSKWTDNCAEGGEIQSDGGVDNGSSEDGCFQFRLYTFTVTDNCGNSATETTIVSREYDTTAPEISDIEDFKLEGCNASWPGYLVSKWTDNCSEGGEIQSDGGVDNGSSEDGCTEFRLYTFTITDNCGNSAIETTIVSREYDTTDPEITDLEDFQLESCNEAWPEFLSTTWSDNCAEGGEIQSDGGVDNGSSEDGCTEFRLYTFTITDNCGNSAIETTIVSREIDTTDPEITDLEDFQLESCNEAWPEFLTTTWSDNCAEGGEIQSDGGVDNGSSEDGCTEFRLYTFTVTDNCGNSTIETTIVSREYDTTDPEITDLEDFQLESCNEAWPEFLTTTWSDNCAEGGEIQSDGGVDNGSSEDGCTEFRLYTFTVTDNCENTAIETTIVSREIDTTDPQITDLEDFQLESCNEAWPEFLSTTWSDNCADGGEIQSDGGVDNGSSEDGSIEFRLYTFEVTDACGNSAMEQTNVSRVIGTGIIEGDSEEICAVDFPGPPGSSFDLNELLPEDTEDGGVWTVEESPDAIDVPISEEGTIVTTDLPQGDYIFRYEVQGEVCSIIYEVYLSISSGEGIIEGGSESICPADFPGPPGMPYDLNVLLPDGTATGGIWTLEESPDDIEVVISDEGAIITIDLPEGDYVFRYEVEGEVCSLVVEVYLNIFQEDTIIEGGSEDVCAANFPGPPGIPYDLTVLLPDDAPTGGDWSLVSSPNNIEVAISEEGTIVTIDLPEGIYDFQYELGGAGCGNMIYEVFITILPPGDEPCVGSCQPNPGTALTPNGDGENDTFFGGFDDYARNIGCRMHVRIYNRWGAKIFEDDDYKNDWDGRVPSGAFGSANRITTGTYFYVITYNDGESEQTLTGYIYVATQ